MKPHIDRRVADNHRTMRHVARRVERLETRLPLASNADFFTTMPREFVSVGDVEFFRSAGTLWQTDGTAAGTRSVHQPPEWPAQASIGNLTRVAGSLFFLLNGHYLSRTGPYGEGGITIVRDLRPTMQIQGTCSCGEISQFQGFREFAGASNSLFFSKDWVDGWQLWSSDGTDAGTTMIASFSDRSYLIQSHRFTTLQDKLLFVASDGEQRGLWVSDGTIDGTSLLKPMVGQFETDLFGLREYMGRVYFFSRSAVDTARIALWKTDGSASGTREVFDFGPMHIPGLYIAGGSIWTDFATTDGGVLYFTAADTTHGLELWQTDGTTSGTRLVADLHPGSASSAINSVAVSEGVLFVETRQFTPEGYVTNEETLWRIDATGNARPIIDGSSDPIGTSMGNVTSFHGMVHFGIGVGGEPSVWQVETDSGATTKLFDGVSFGVRNGRLYYQTNDEQTGAFLWATTGSWAQAERILALSDGTLETLPADFNRDGSVDAEDLSLLVRDFGALNATANRGDATLDGRVGLADLITLRNRLAMFPPATASSFVVDRRKARRAAAVDAALALAEPDVDMNTSARRIASRTRRRVIMRS